MFRMKNKTLSGVDREKMLRNSGTYVVLLVALGAMTFFGVCDPPGGQQGPQGSAARVGDEVVSMAEFNRAYQETYSNYQRQYGDQFDPKALRIASTVLTQLVNSRVLYVKAIEMGMRASDAEVVKVLTDAEAFRNEDGTFNEEFYDNYLRRSGYTEKSFHEEIRRNVTVQKMRRFLTQTNYVSRKSAEMEFRVQETKLNVEYLKFDPQKVQVEVTPADIEAFLASEDGKGKVKAYFDNNPAEFNKPEEVKARHILVGFKGARNASAEAATREKDAAKARAEEILAQVTAKPADFEKIAKEKTDEAAGKTSGGDLGWFTRETMVKEFSDAAFALEKGKLSAVIESPFGFHVIKVEDKRAAVNRTLEESQNEIANNLLSKEKRPEVAKQQADAVLAALKGGGDAKDLIAQYNIKWESTGQFGTAARFIPGIGADDAALTAVLGLQTVGELHQELVELRGTPHVMRLKELVQPDLSKFDDKRADQMANSAAFAQGFALFSAFEKAAVDQMDARGKIWRNEEYLALDQPSGTSGG